MKKKEEWNQFFSAAVDQSFDGIAIADLDYKTMYLNPAWANMHGYDSAEELIGKPIDIFHNREQIEKGVKPFIQVVKEKGKHTGEMRHIRKDGTPFSTLMTTTLLKDAQETPIAILNIIKDISDLKKEQNALYEKERLLSESQRIAQIGSWSLWFKDKDGQINWTDEMYKLYGVDSSTFTPDIPSFLSLIHPDDKPMLQAWIDDCIAGKNPAELIFRNLRADGSIHYISGQGAAIYDTAGRAIGITGTAQDITERIQADELLLDSILKFQNLIESTSDWVWEVDEEGRYTYVSSKIRDLLGYEPEEVLHRTPFDLMPPEEVKRVKKIFDHAAARHEPIRSLENTNLHKDGHPVILETSGVPFFDSGGKFRGYRGIDRDISERKLTEKKLRESENRFKELTEMLPEAVFEADTDINLIYANQQAMSLFGYTNQDLENGLNGIDLLVPEDREKARKNLAKRLQGEAVGSVEYHALKKDGSILPVLMHTSLIFKQGAFNGTRGIIVDITTRKQAELALRKSEARLQSIISAAPTGIGVVTNRVLVEVNSRICEMTGHTKDELVGKSARILYPTQKDFEFVGREKYRQIADRGAGAVETRWIRKDGSILNVFLSSNPIIPGDLSAGVTFTATDITELKQSEKKLLKQREKLEETNTALRVILRESEITKKELEQNVLSNVKQLLLPYVTALESKPLAEEQQFFLDIIKASISEITSPFSKELNRKIENLTPREIQVADLIKQGRTNKEIARLLNITTSGVDFHRRNLRNKLNIKNKKKNLRSILLSYVG
jgi:PAS domain S-box-containing protein